MRKDECAVCKRTIGLKEEWFRMISMDIHGIRSTRTVCGACARPTAPGEPVLDKPLPRHRGKNSLRWWWARLKNRARAARRPAKLDLRHASLATRLPEPIFRRIHEDIGEATCCWTEYDIKGVLDAERASRIAFNLCHYIADRLEEARK